MWHLYSRVDGKVTTYRAVSWRVLHRRLVTTEIPKLYHRSQPTILTLAADAQPDKFWSCAGEQFSFKLRPIHEHDPIPKADPMATEEIDHKERGHSTLGASATHRWWPCLGSNNLIAALGVQDVPTIYMMQGTAAHELAHMCLLRGQDAIEYIDRRIEEFIVDDEMASAVQTYLDVCRSLIRPDVIVLVEKQFTLKSLNPPKPMFGTADFVVIDEANRTITVVDFKYGVGWVVDADNNPQLMYYLLGVLCAFPNVPITRLRGVIVQPRARTGPTIKEAEFKPSALHAWATELIARARLTMDPDAPRSAGPHCQYCQARGRCPTQTEAAYDAAQSEFYAEPLQGEVIAPLQPPAKEEVRILTPEQLGVIRQKFPILKEFMDSVDEAIHALLNDGVEVPGFKLVAGEGHRKWGDEEAVPDLLTSRLGLAQEETREVKVISPKQAERLAIAKLRDMGFKLKDAEPRVKRILDDLTVRPQTKPLLVSDKDIRPALPVRGSEFDFETLPAPENN